MEALSSSHRRLTHRRVSWRSSSLADASSSLQQRFPGGGNISGWVGGRDGQAAPGSDGALQGLHGMPPDDWAPGTS